MKTQQTLTMMDIGNDLILVKTDFGCLFINKKIGAQVEDPETRTITPREKTLWEKYAFLEKKEIHTPYLYARVRTIVQRVAQYYLKP
jgi:hypothetical protein